MTASGECDRSTVVGGPRDSRVVDASGPYDPRTHAAELGVTVEYQPLAGALAGRYLHHRRLIILRPGLTARAERCTLAHEVVHAEYGDLDTTDPILHARQEARADRLAARRLIDPAAWDYAWRLHRDLRAVAVELDVTFWLAAAHAADVERRLAAAEGGAA